jgi:hypothetical protein
MSKTIRETWNYAAATSGIAATTTAVTIKAAEAGARNYIDSIQVSHDTLGNATSLAIRDGAGGTVLWRGRLQTTAMPVNNTIHFATPLKGSINTLLEVVTLTSATGGVYVNAQGHVAA